MSDAAARADRMRSLLTDVLGTVIEELSQPSRPAPGRYVGAHDVLEQLEAASKLLRAARGNAAEDLHHRPYLLKWDDVGALVGVSGVRALQHAQAATGAADKTPDEPLNLGDRTP